MEPDNTQEPTPEPQHFVMHAEPVVYEGIFGPTPPKPDEEQP